MPYPEDWVTRGYSRHNGKWLEMGGEACIKVTPPPLPPQLGLHDVADKLNELEAEIVRLNERRLRKVRDASA